MNTLGCSLTEPASPSLACVAARHPDWIPYRTGYYGGILGFCLSQRRLEGLSDGEWRVSHRLHACKIGSLSYGECACCLDRSTTSSHLRPHLSSVIGHCDSLSGVAVATALARVLASTPAHRYTYRASCSELPGTIGPIAWLVSGHQAAVERVKHGLVRFGLRRRSGRHRLQTQSAPECGYRSGPWSMCLRGAKRRAVPGPGFLSLRLRRAAVLLSPGFSLPAGSFSPHPAWRSAPEVSCVGRQSRVRVCRPSRRDSPRLHAARGSRRSHRERSPLHQSRSHAEPQLGRRGPGTPRSAAPRRQGRSSAALLWVLNLSDGNASVLDIAERSGQPILF